VSRRSCPWGRPAGRRLSGSRIRGAAWSWCWWNRGCWHRWPAGPRWPTARPAGRRRASGGQRLPSGHGPAVSGGHAEGRLGAAGPAPLPAAGPGRIRADRRGAGRPIPRGPDPAALAVGTRLRAHHQRGGHRRTPVPGGRSGTGSGQRRRGAGRPHRRVGTAVRPSVTSRGLYLLPTGADATHADWLRTGHEISGNVVEFEPEVTTRDVFYLDEARIRQNLIGPIARVWIDQFRSDPEIAAASRTLPNPIALPEIAVSRINASHVAVRLPSDRSLATGTRGRLVDGAVTDAARPVHQHRQLRHRAERRPGRVGDPARRVRTGPAPRTPAAGRASGQQPPLPHRGVVDPARFGGRGGSSGRRRLLRTRGRRCAGAGAARGGPAS